MALGSWSKLRKKAKRELEDARQNGLERIVWDISWSDDAEFPESDIESGDQFKGEWESPEQYIRRMAYDSDFSEDDTFIYFTLDSRALRFTKNETITDITKEFVRFFLDIADTVDVRYRHFDLEYGGWIESSLVPDDAKTISPPFRKTYQSD